MTQSTINFLATLARRSSSVQRHYGLYVRRFLADCLGCQTSEIDLERLDSITIHSCLTRAHLESYLGRLKKDGFHFHPIHHTRSGVLLLARELADSGVEDYDLIERLRTTPIPHTEVGQDPGIWLTPDQSYLMLEHLRNDISPSDETSHPEKVRALTMIIVMLVCGLRSNEVTSMNWSDCITDGGSHILRVHGKGSKLRLIKLPQSVVATLNTWNDLCVANGISGGPIFKALKPHRNYNAITRRGIKVGIVTRTVRQAGHLIGIDSLAPHDLRRTCARNAYLAGASFELIRQMLGHRSVLTTQTYVNAPLALERSATDIVAESLSFHEDVSVTSSEKAISHDEPLLTREEAACYLGINVPKFDRLRKREGLEATESRSGKTRPFMLYRLSDIEKMKGRME